MTVAAPARFIVAATLPGTDAVAVEPQTHAPDGLRRLARGEPGALALLPPGGRLELTMGLALRADVRLTIGRSDRVDSPGQT